MPLFPALFSSVMPLVDIPPSFDTSYISPYSLPNPNVPEAITTGFLKLNFPKSTLLELICEHILSGKNGTVLACFFVSVFRAAGAYKACPYSTSHSLFHRYENLGASALSLPCQDFHHGFRTAGKNNVVVRGVKHVCDIAPYVNIY